jgi:hypothetical protein
MNRTEQGAPERNGRPGHLRTTLVVATAVLAIASSNVAPP